MLDDIWSVADCILERCILLFICKSQMVTVVLTLRSYSKVVSLFVFCYFNQWNDLSIQFYMLSTNFVHVHASVVCMLWIMITFDFCVKGCEFEYWKT